MKVYYNEFDPFAAEWLRQLIKAGAIADGVVDSRDIREVKPDELREFDRCHFFAGIGGWEYALRLADWPESLPVWTGSCPCQAFSTAGKRKGFDDERHLWPTWFNLIRECRPPVIFGEQVASAGVIGKAHGKVTGEDKSVWLDLVQSDLEETHYAFGAAVIPACGFGAPHIRQRTYFVAYAEGNRHQQRIRGDKTGEQRAPSGCRENGGGGGYDTTDGSDDDLLGSPRRGSVGEGATRENRVVRRMGDTQHHGYSTPKVSGGNRQAVSDGSKREDGTGKPPGASSPHTLSERVPTARTSQTNGFWRDADWLYCRDGKWRAVEPGVEPLADGVPNRVGKLRGYGNAIVAPQAAEFIKAAREIYDAG